MCKVTLLIFSLILVFIGCALSCDKQIGTPTTVVTKSFIDIDGDPIRREHDPETGLVVTSTFFDGKTYVPGIEADLWICDGEITVKSDPESSEGRDCRQLISTLELFGRTNPGYSCGGWACFFWP
ncbi:MAG: hypothetical protein C4B58_03175 [Deltaproteobacteria bacterium]|nr:MAG: hypothetical protein C4B58_03175 [Deltaproteobacteria bacterium]